MSEISNALSKYNETKERENATSYIKRDRISEMQEEIFNSYKELAKDLKGYGYNFKIKTSIYSGMGKIDTFTLIFSPWEKDDYLLLGELGDEKDIHIYYSFNPDFIDGDDKFKKNQKTGYISCLEFVTVQIYKQKDVLMAKMKEAILADIEEKTHFSEVLIKCMNETC